MSIAATVSFSPKVCKSVCLKPEIPMDSTDDSSQIDDSRTFVAPWRSALFMMC